MFIAENLFENKYDLVKSRMKYTFITIIIALSVLNSCKKNLKENQLKIINCVNIGDTLIFQTDNSERDTMVISDKGVYYQELNPIFGNTWFRPQNAFIKFYNTNRDKGQFYDLVYIYGGMTPFDSNRIVIKIRSSHHFLSETKDNLGELKSNPIEVNGKVYTNYFIRTDFCQDCPIQEDSSDIKQLFWSLEKGPLMYIDIKNQKWERIK